MSSRSSWLGAPTAAPADAWRRRVALVLVLAPAVLLAALPARAEPEVDSAEFTAPPLAQPGPDEPLPIDLTLEAGLRWLAPLEDDMSNVYGGFPVLESRLGAWASERAFIYFGVGYGSVKGDPWSGDPTFTAGSPANLTLVPLEIGERWELAQRPGFRVNLGWRFELAWVRETIPDGGRAAGATRRESGWLRGFGVSAGPEWLSRDGRRAAGFEAGLTGSGGKVGGNYGWDSNLSGAWVRIHASTRL